MEELERWIKKVLIVIMVGAAVLVASEWVGLKHEAALNEWRHQQEMLNFEGKSRPPDSLRYEDPDPKVQAEVRGMFKAAGHPLDGNLGVKTGKLNAAD